VGQHRGQYQAFFGVARDDHRPAIPASHQSSQGIERQTTFVFFSVVANDASLLEQWDDLVVELLRLLIGRLHISLVESDKSRPDAQAQPCAGAYCEQTPN
jgi:hypothetical protein